MTTELHSCVCLASFPTETALESHLSDYKAQIAFHSARLEVCSAHFKVNEDDEVRSDDASNRIDPDPSFRSCPHESCYPSKIVPTAQGLRRHFATHLECNDVCVFCHKLYKVSSEFINHVRSSHREAGGTKGTYMRNRSQELQDDSNQQLYRAKYVFLKRRAEEANIVLNSPAPCRRRLSEHSWADANHQRSLPAGSMMSVMNPCSTPRDSSSTETNYLTLVDPPSTYTSSMTSGLRFESGPQSIPSPNFDPWITQVVNWEARWDSNLIENSFEAPPLAMEPS